MVAGCLHSWWPCFSFNYYCCICSSGMIPLPVFMVWISMLYLNVLVTVWDDVEDANLVLEFSIELPRRMQWSGSKSSTRVWSLTSPRISGIEVETISRVYIIVMFFRIGSFFVLFHGKFIKQCNFLPAFDVILSSKCWTHARI